MQNLSNTSCEPLFSADPGGAAPFRSAVRGQDVCEIEWLVTRAGVFNPEEILVAQSLATEALARGADAGYFFLFADGVEGLDGYTCYGPIPGNAGRFELYWIAVEPRSKRQGLAGRLLAASEQSVRSRSGSHMFAETSSRADYAAAHALYAAQGYKLHATVPDYHAAGDDLLIFGKIL